MKNAPDKVKKTNPCFSAYRLSGFSLIVFLGLLAACGAPADDDPAALGSDKAITGFSFENPAAEGTINAENRTVTVTVPFGTERKDLVPTVTISGVHIDPPSGVARDFRSRVEYTVTAEDGSEETWTVYVNTAGLNGVAAVTEYLSGLTGGGSADNPVSLSVNVGIPGDWANLLAAIETAGKYVALDLSTGAMTGAEFDPLSGVSGAGEAYIVSLTLPAAATGVKAGSEALSFRHFTSLKSVSGANVTSIGDYAFYKCAALKTLSFPAVKTIGVSAFEECVALETLSLPVVTSIGNYAFNTCKALRSLSFPRVQSIGHCAFALCDALTTVSLPASLMELGNNLFAGCENLTGILVNEANTAFKAEGGMLLNKAGDTLIGYPSARGAVTLDSTVKTVGGYAFYSCEALKTLKLPAVKTVYLYAFGFCSALETVELPEAQSIRIRAFGNTGSGALTVTLGSKAPTLGEDIFLNSVSKTVTIKVPSGATGYGTIPFTYSGDDKTANWGNGFRGGGWNNSAFTKEGNINSNITLHIGND
ncbi:MAG: leucine-rich repeat protein [Treponema sp.]|jgi:hypothetical protein|nr:leucine-rich repeat protein [Treponema sp.]